MIGKVRLTSVSYGQFCRKLRLLVPGVSKSMLYREWCRELDKYGNIKYEKIARRLKPQPKRGEHE